MCAYATIPTCLQSCSSSRLSSLAFTRIWTLEYPPACRSSLLSSRPTLSPSMAAMICMYSSAIAPAAASTCRRETVTEEQVEELAYQEEGRCKSRLVSRKRRQEGGEEEEMWEGTVRREIEADAEAVWEMLGSFGEMKRWNANADVCDVVEGEDNQPGCVRFCAGGGRAADGSPLRWVREKLLTVQPTQRCYTYCILESSYGFQRYRAKMSVLPVHLSPGRTLAHWTFELCPVAHSPPPHFLAFLTSIFDNMMSSLERTILAHSR